MKTIVNQLNEKDLFNIIMFSNDVTNWRPEFLSGTEGNKNQAMTYIDSLTADGSKKDNVTIECVKTVNV